jgi:hypothetical protein
MRLKDHRGLRGTALWTWVALVLCAFASKAVASGLICNMPSPWVGAAATALSLMLITAVSANQK